MYEATTTIAIYRSDHSWLLARQRKVSFEREKTVPMCDVMHELIEALQRAEEGA